jgi:type III secretory pathway component EscS
MTVLSLAIYVMRYTTLALERVSFYFTPGVVVALPDAISSLEDANLRAAVQVVAISLALALFVYRLFTSEWALYRFFWQ